jgi:hypothetical protein
VADRDGDGSTMDDRARAAAGRDDDRDGVDDRQESGARAEGDTSDYQQGRIDERREEDSRFGRSPAPDQDRVR